MLTLYEELFLLAFHEDKGKLIPTTTENLPVGLAGAILAELVLNGRLQVEENHRLVVLDASPIQDEILDAVLEKIQSSERPRKVSYWVNQLNEKPKKLFDQMEERLEAKGILLRDESNLISMPSQNELDGHNASARYWLKRRLRGLALTDQDVELRGLALLNLVQACDFIDLIFTKDERKIARRRIYELLVGTALSNGQAQAIEEIERAVEAQADTD
jgi:golgi phosphoprotein 3